MSDLEEDRRLALKIRTVVDEQEIVWVVALATSEMIEVARIRESLLTGSGDPLFHAWVDNIAAMHRQIIERATGLKVAAMRRRKANYKGE